MLSVVIPTLNAQEGLAACLTALVPGAMAGLVRDVIVVDGGSSDATQAIAEAGGCTWVESERGRGKQLRAGAAVARAPWLLFLHADTILDGDWVGVVQRFLAAADAPQRAAAFAFALDDDSLAARHLAFWVGVRCAALRLPYGDQGLLIHRALYDQTGGYKDIPLMEDLDFVRRLGPGRLAMLRARAVTSAARFRRDGYLRRSTMNLVLAARFLLGADPADLVKAYERRPSSG